jgi:hypothetical protein
MRTANEEQIRTKERRDYTDCVGVAHGMIVLPVLMIRFNLISVMLEQEATCEERSSRLLPDYSILFLCQKRSDENSQTRNKCEQKRGGTILTA